MGSNKYASQSGEVVIGSRRNQLCNIRGRLPKHPKARVSELFIPFQSGTNIFANQSGMADPPAVGAYRQATMECEGLNWSEELVRKSGLITPWYAGTNKFANQTGSGGFMKYRDVLFKMVGGKEISEEFLNKCHGVLRLQSGTNKLASQRGMTGFGTPRNVVNRPKWKNEWIEEWGEAEKEFETSGRGRRHLLEEDGTLSPTAVREEPQEEQQEEEEEEE